MARDRDKIFDYEDEDDDEDDLNQLENNITVQYIKQGKP